MCPSSSQMSIQHGLSSETCQLQKGILKKRVAHDWGSTGGACRHYHKRWLAVVLEIIYVEKCWMDVLEIHCSAWPQTHNVFRGDRIQWKCLVRERDDHNIFRWDRIQWRCLVRERDDHNVFRGDRIQWRCLVRERDDHNVFRGDRIQWRCLVRERDDHNVFRGDRIQWRCLMRERDDHNVFRGDRMQWKCLVYDKMCLWSISWTLMPRKLFLITCHFLQFLAIISCQKIMARTCHCHFWQEHVIDKNGNNWQ